MVKKKYELLVMFLIF